MHCISIIIGLSYPSSICKPVSLQEPMIGPVAVVEEHFDTRTISIIAQELGRRSVQGHLKFLSLNFSFESYKNLLHLILWYSRKINTTH